VLAHAPSGMKSFKKLASRHFQHGHEFRRYKRQVNIYDHHTTKNFFKLNHYRRPPTPMKVRRSPSPPSSDSRANETSETSRAALYSGAHKMEQSRRPEMLRTPSPIGRPPLYPYGQGKLTKLPTDFSYLKEELLGWSTPTTPAAPFSPPTTPVKRPPTKSMRTPEPDNCIVHPDSPSYQLDVDMDYDELLMEGNRRLTYVKDNCLISALEYLDLGEEIEWLEDEPTAVGDTEMAESPLPDSPQSPSILSSYSADDEMSFTEVDVSCYCVVCRADKCKKEGGCCIHGK
jgi:hypothetical protein